MQDSNKESESIGSQSKSPQSKSPGPFRFATAAPAGREVETSQLGARRGIPEFSELVLACRHHLRLTAFLGALVSTIFAVGGWLLTNAAYESESLVQVRRHQDIVFTAQTPRGDDISFVRAQEQMVVSPQVLAEVLKAEQIQLLSDHIPTHDAVDWLRDVLRVEIQAGAEVMGISVRHSSPLVSQTLCNTVTETYLAEVANRLAADRQTRDEELERAAREADRQLDQLWAELNQVAEQVGSDNTHSLTIRDEIQLQAYRDYAQQLRAAQLRGNELQRQLAEERLRMANEQSTFEDDTEEILQNRPEVVAARERVDKIDSTIQQMREVAASEDSPRLTRFYADRQFLSESLDQLVNELRPQLREQAREQYRNKLENSLVQLQQQIELNESEKEFLHGRMTEMDATIVRTDEKNGVQLEMSRHAVDRQMRLADRLWQALEEFRIESQSQPRVKLIELAQLPRQANHGRRLKVAAAATAIGWMIVILSIGWFEWKTCRVRHGNDLKTQSTRPVFGANDVSAQWPTKETSFGSGVREAAVRLMLPNNNGKTIPSVIVSSASANEPRHLVSLELARTFQSFRRRTLLIDCDTSRLELSRLLGADQLSGMLQVCPNRPNPRQYVVPSCEEGLDFMPLGLSQGTVPWIDPVVCRFVLDALRGDYDAIVVNGPAIMSSAESLLLASQVDQTLLAAFIGKSRWNQLAASEQIADHAGIAVFGSVLHSAKRLATLELRFDDQGTTCRVSDQVEVTEEDLKETVAAIRQDLHQTASPHRVPEIETVANKGFNS